MATIVPSPSVTLRQASQFVTALEALGITGVHLQRCIVNPQLRLEVARLMRGGDTPLIDINKPFDKKAMIRFIDYYFTGSENFPNTLNSYESRMKAGGSKRLPGGFTREELCSETVIRTLLQDLSEVQKAVVVLRIGLLDGIQLSTKLVAERCNLSPRSINGIRAAAKSLIKAHTKDFPAPKTEFAPTVDNSISDLGASGGHLANVMVSRGLSCRIGDLIAFSPEELWRESGLTVLDALDLQALLYEYGFQMKSAE